MLLPAVALLPILRQTPAPTTLPNPETEYKRPANRVSGNTALRIYFLRTSYANETDSSVSRHSEDSLKKIGSQLDAFLRIQSYGLMSVQKFEVSPVIKLGNSDSYEKFDKEGTAVKGAKKQSPINDAIRNASRLIGRNLRKEFDMICIVLNESPTGGRISPKGVAAFSTGSQNSVFLTANPNWKVFAHEIGHNFGFPHAWSVADNDGTAVLSKNQTFTEYGDPASPMGTGMNSYSIIEKYRMGWMGSSEQDVRFIKKFTPGEFSFGAYDRPDAKGCVGGYLEGDFGIALRDLVSRRVNAKNNDSAAIANPAPERIWFNVVTRENFADNAMRDAKQPLLLAHLSSLVPSVTGGTRASTTVSLDLKPGKAPRPRRQKLSDTGLAPGETASILMKDGSSMLVRFVKFDSVSQVATVNATIQK